MRKIALLALLPLAASATPAQVETRVAGTSTSGTTAVDFRGTSPNVSQLSSTLSARSPGLLQDSLVVTASVSTAKNDYSNTMLIDEEGGQAPLSRNFNGSEISGEAGLEWKGGPHTASLAYGQMLSSRSPFPYRAISAGYNIGFWGNGTVLGTNYSWSKQEQPRTFFTDPRDFRIKQRPESLRAQRAELWIEQVLSDRWKAQLRLIEGQRLEDRPLHFGLELRNAYAVSSRISGRLDAGTLQEKHQGLKDERGYYSVYWGELQATYEVVYDFLLTASLGTTVEREEIPWNGARNQVGTDTYGLKASYKKRNWSLSLGGQTSNSNTSYRMRSLQGDFVWEI